MGRPVLDLDGQRFGRLVATDKLRKKGRVLQRLCICDCGNKTWQVSNHLTSGHTKSCGCLLGEFKKLAPGRAVRNQILDSYKRGARERGLKWELTDEEFDYYVAQNCHYCNRPPSTTRKARRMNGDFTYNGIDRMDNDEGYLPSNIVSCCQICNRAKHSLDMSDFLAWIKDISETYYANRTI